MTLKFRDDPGLDVLALADDKDLGRLADLLTYDETDGEKRVAQQLLDDPSFKTALVAGTLSSAWKAIAAELQTFGGDGAANAVRGTGVTYWEILSDLAGALGVEIGKTSDVRTCETLIVHQLLLDRYFPNGEPTRSPPARSAALEIDCLELIDGSLIANELLARLELNEDFLMKAILVLRRLPLFQFKLPTENFLRSIKGLPTENLIRAVKGISPKQSITGAAYRVTLPAVLEVTRIRRKVLRNPLNLRET